MTGKLKHEGLILFIVNVFIFLSFIASFAATTTYTYDDVNRKIRIETGHSPGGGLSPVADFSASPTTGFAPLAVNFIDLSTNNPASWQWDFGDSSTSTAQNPLHVYTSQGSYTVSLTVSNAHGSDSVSRPNYITVQACPNLPVRVLGHSTLYYSTLQAAYDAAESGSVIQSQAVRFTGNLNVNRNITVTLEGGYNCNYSTNSGSMTLIKGMITTSVGGGRMTIKNFVIEQ